MPTLPDGKAWDRCAHRAMLYSIFSEQWHDVPTVNDARVLREDLCDWFAEIDLQTFEARDLETMWIDAQLMK